MAPDPPHHFGGYNSSFPRAGIGLALFLSCIVTLKLHRQPDWPHPFRSDMFLLMCFFRLIRRLLLLAMIPGWVAVASLIAQNPQPNLALIQPVDASGPTWGGLVPAGLTDGNPNSFSHPLAASGTRGFYYEIDLGSTYHLDRILLRNRADGCCPERLSRYRVELYADNGGESGALNWSALIRGDGSHSGSGGVDTVRAIDNPGGRFVGRFVRIVNDSGAAYNPQVAEVEVYGGFTPVIRQFAADDDTIGSGESATLHWEIENATGASLSPEPGTVLATNGTAVVRPLATTFYTLTATNEAGGSTAVLGIGVDVRLDPPEITELLANPGDGLKDEDGDDSDWIEIWNPNPFSLELEGFGLTDDAADLGRWTFPNVRLPAQSRRVIFASGKDRREPFRELHTNFRLSADGDYLALVDRAQGGVIQQIPADSPATRLFPRQLPGIGYGLGTNGAFGFLRPATPGEPNGPAFAGVVSDTKFSPDRGFYLTNIAVEISCATPGATIRYTLDRSAPTATRGTVYTAPIAISSTTVLRAAAFREGWAPTDVDTQTYVFPAQVIQSSVMNTGITRHPVYSGQILEGLLQVPSVSLVTSAAVNGSSEVKTSIEWLRPDGAPGFQEDCGVRHYGGAFTEFAKKNFRLYFRSEYGAARLNYPLFAGFDRDLAAVEEFNQLELRGGSHDMADRGFYMANIITDDTVLDMGQLNPHGRFVHLYLNGGYHGLFQLRERWDAAMHQSYLGGSRTNYESINGNWNVGGWADPGVRYDGDGSTWARIKELRGRYEEVRKWLDVPQYTDYMLMWMFGGSEDEYRCVGPTVPGTGFKFYLNDADGWFCGPWYCAADDRTRRGAQGRGPGDGPGSLFSMLFREGHPDYRTLLADRIHLAYFNGGALTPERGVPRLQDRCDEIEKAFVAEAARWNYLSPAAWATRRDYSLTNWLVRRPVEALAQLRGGGLYPGIDAPVLNQQGGVVPEGFRVRFEQPRQGTVWFTTDGTDPRMPGGGISPRAFSYTTGGTAETLVPAGARWRWITDAAGLGASDIVAGHISWSAANWKHSDFEDTGWREGPAQLGYGEGDEVTVLPSGPSADKWPAAYFRRESSVDDPGSITSLKLRLKRDDGAIVYLNGHELARSSIRAGVVSGTTYGDGPADDGQSFVELAGAANLLVAGSNVIAAELHQATPNTSDASFDLELSATRIEPDGEAGSLPVINTSTVIKARALDGGQWSALNEAFFQVGAAAIAAGELVVTEMNLNPARAGGVEFLEMANLASRAINLRGVRFTDGIQYAFPVQADTVLAPGQRLVLVKDLFRFRERYGLEIPVAGVYAGGLASEGENVTIEGASGEVLTQFQFGALAPWPGAGAAAGYTLVLSHPERGLDHPAAWRLSADLHGSPGGSDEAVFVGAASDDADGDGLPALVEYALGTSDLDAASGSDAVITEWTDGGKFTVSFSRNLRAAGVSLTVEVSEDLAEWQPAVLYGSVHAGAGVARETWGAEIGGRARLFLRLRVIR